MIRNQTATAIGAIDERIGVTESWADLLSNGAQAIGVFGTNALEVIDNVALRWRSFQNNLQNSDASQYVVLRGIGDAFQRIGGFLSPLVSYMDDVAIGLGGIATAKVGIGLTAGALGLVSGAITAIGVCLLYTSPSPRDS